jgi:glycosyltransferase involved in cell wall biosynthesis
MLVGRGEQKEDEAALLAEAAKLGVADAVTITGWLPMQRAWDYVRAADVCLSPYSPISILRSTSPTKLVEYMALSKPVVANDHPEQSLVVQQSGAGIVTGWDEAAFAGAVTYLLEHEREAEAMGRAGRAFVERYRTHRHMGELVESRYKAALGEAAGASGAAAFGLSE